MKRNEIITLCAGVLLIIFFGWIAKPSVLAILSINSNNMSQKSTLPSVAGPNISKDSKLQIIEVSAGTGAEAVKGSHIYVNYTGMLEDGSKFDSSYDRGTPIDFTVGSGQVIKGWDFGLLGMKVGGKRRLVISPDYAYGVNGIPGAIPGNATLVFDLELVNVK